jgi:hypothetical protein
MPFPGIVGVRTRVARFILVQNIKTGKKYQIATKYTNIRNGHEIF